MQKGGYVYILTNRTHSTLYVGVTSDLQLRLQQHRSKVFTTSFTARYNLDKLVYYCFYPTIEQAIAEEKRIKGGSRAKKIKLIEELNSKWDDLSEMS